MSYFAVTSSDGLLPDLGVGPDATFGPVACYKSRVQNLHLVRHVLHVVMFGPYGPSPKSLSPAEVSEFHVSFPKREASSSESVDQCI